MEGHVMTIDEFEDLLDRCGDDVASWPVAHRQAGLALLRESHAARDLVEEAWSMRQAFAPDPSQRAPAGLADRIIAQAAASSDAPAPGAFAPIAAWRMDGPLRPAVVLSCCFAIGFTLSLLPAAKSPSTGVSHVATPYAAKTQDGVQVDVPALLAGLWQ